VVRDQEAHEIPRRSSVRWSRLANEPAPATETTMRVILLHNPTAGNQRHDADELAAMIEDAGHDVVKVVSRKEELADALRTGCDLVAVAGGDGTVGKAASIVTGTQVPLTILPA